MRLPTMRATNSAGTWKHANQTEYIAKVHFTLQLEANCPVIEIDSLAEYHIQCVGETVHLLNRKNGIHVGRFKTCI